MLVPGRGESRIQILPLTAILPMLIYISYAHSALGRTFAMSYIPFSEKEGQVAFLTIV